MTSNADVIETATANRISHTLPNRLRFSLRCDAHPSHDCTEATRPSVAASSRQRAPQRKF
ncbi:hypothetical protein V5735_11880 (plasmid) [Haladaptatus sp. SPP-AMP-3]|uniref:hypothetical protein n=1 Tax=Haladaptatus sp. SPP-AMP-3 TaxID=3121295 RepID=UPI003C2C0415